MVPSLRDEEATLVLVFEQQKQNPENLIANICYIILRAFPSQMIVEQRRSVRILKRKY